jgi:hypothetical protein
MLDGAKELWVLCYATRTKENIVVQKSDYSYWASYLPKDYEFIAEGKHALMKTMQKLIKESTC